MSDFREDEKRRAGELCLSAAFRLQAKEKGDARIMQKTYRSMSAARQPFH